MRFSCSTGDAMGMNMVSKGVQNVLDYLQDDFPDMEVISISGELWSNTLIMINLIISSFSLPCSCLMCDFIVLLAHCSVN